LYEFYSTEEELEEDDTKYRFFEVSYNTASIWLGDNIRSVVGVFDH
jgi:hypothetical protein